MPARTVVFTASRKFDGTDFRWISAGEYIQVRKGGEMVVRGWRMGGQMVRGSRVWRDLE